ncbi:zinc finger protein 511 [Nephila pilipes]|uniref:Zinc finger protein 511 n=1 Tax=Nephila pilipes TaxID=299642 RepID=A0A8X6NJA0_NEPPI|nr:zinc finger protein 511 [Nephila pilipes]
MNSITSVSDYTPLFTVPFQPKKVIYSLNSEFFQKGNAICKTDVPQLAVDLSNEDQSRSLPEFPCCEMSCRATFSNIRDYEIHFRSVHSFVCSECKRTFLTYNMLDIHIQEKHDSYHQAARAKNLAKFDCFVEGCKCTYDTLEQRVSHVINDHKFPPNFKYQPLKKAAPEFEAMDVSESQMKSNLPTSSRRKPYVPSNVCFGRGSARTFSKKTLKKSDTEITMKELGDAL